MARSIYSPSPSPVSPSPSFSDSSSEEVQSISGFSEQTDAQHHHSGPSISRPGSPTSVANTGTHAGDVVPEDSVTCEWDGCGKVYTHLPTLIDHIHNDHIGVNKSSYTCEWASCTRRGLAQTSRFALISHIRSHTGEKPFTCLRPECDKSFTRSDALAKHMRLQHNISPPAPGRGGFRKRKRGNDDQAPSSSRAGSSNQQHSLANLNPSDSEHPCGPFGSFQVEQHTPSEFDDPLDGGYFALPRSNGHGHSMSPFPPTPPLGSFHPNYNNHDSPSSSPPPTPSLLPAHLLPHYDPQTNTVLGRSPAMVLYLLMKAKHRYAMEQHEELLEELRVVRGELKKAKDEKEEAVDALLRGVFGAEGEQFITPIPVPASMMPVTSQPAPAQNPVTAPYVSPESRYGEGYQANGR